MPDRVRSRRAVLLVPRAPSRDGTPTRSASLGRPSGSEPSRSLAPDRERRPVPFDFGRIAIYRSDGHDTESTPVPRPASTVPSWSETPRHRDTAIAPELRALLADGGQRPFLPPTERERAVGPAVQELAHSIGVSDDAVDVRTDAEAARRARSLGAPAVSAGDHIDIDLSRVDPRAPTGRRVLAHELVHRRQRQLDEPTSASIADVEGEAAELADAAARGGAVRVPQMRLDPARVATFTEAPDMDPEARETMLRARYTNRMGKALEAIARLLEGQLDDDRPDGLALDAWASAHDELLAQGIDPEVVVELAPLNVAIRTAAAFMAALRDVQHIHDKKDAPRSSEPYRQLEAGHDALVPLLRTLDPRGLLRRLRRKKRKGKPGASQAIDIVDHFAPTLKRLRRGVRKTRRLVAWTREGGQSAKLDGMAVDSRPSSRPMPQVVEDGPDLTAPISKAAKDVALEKLREGLAHDVTRALAEKIIRLGQTKWPHGKLHLMHELIKVYPAGTDPFTWYRQNIVHHNFFGQKVIEVNKRAEPSLRKARELYYEAAAGLPDDQLVMIGKETGAWNFRNERKLKDGSFEFDPDSGHEAGLAIDVNYGTRATGVKNLRVPPDDRVWNVVRAVLKSVGRTGLANAPFGSGKSRDATPLILEASRVFKKAFPAWRSNELTSQLTKVAPGPYDKLDADGLPTRAAYKKALVKVGLDPGKKGPLRDKYRDLQKAERTAKLQRVRLRRQHISRWRGLRRELLGIYRKALWGVARDDRRNYAPQWQRFKQLMKDEWALKEWYTAIDGWTPDRPLSELEGAAQAAMGRLQALRAEMDRLLKDLDTLPSYERKGRKPGLRDVLTSARDVLEVSKHEGELADLSVPSAAADAAVTTKLGDPQLGQARRGQDLLATLELLRKYGYWYRSWEGFGITDLEQAFIKAMEDAGWKWGGRYAREDLHHFAFKGR